MEMAKSLVSAKELPKCFWAEAIHTAAYILNQSPTTALHNRTPFEAWHGWKPKVSHFKVFGCISYVHIPSQKRHKLDDNSVKCVFLGYSVETKGYQFHDPITNKFIVSRDVIFDEMSAWSLNNEAGCSTLLQESAELFSVDEGNSDATNSLSPPSTPLSSSSPATTQSSTLSSARDLLYYLFINSSKKMAFVEGDL